ncbi:MAG: GHKL domain-containing protein [Calditrichaeota bacterium]|nr:GHKL domain-containing protein [Calditrichota bacterium]
MILASIYYSLVKSLIDEIYDQEFLAVSLQKKQIKMETSSLISHIHFLSQEQHLGLLIKDGQINSQIRKEITNRFLNFSQTSTFYDQIRFIQNSGREIIRIDFKNGRSEVVDDNSLQNKKSRYYFKAVSGLQKNQIFVSQLDLKIENGKVERPYKPMVRLGMPVFGDENQRIGMVVVNYLANRFLTVLTETSQINPGEIMLLNGKSYWLKSKNPDDEWGFMFEDKKNRTFANKFPNEWKEISEKQEDQFETDNGLFTFYTINPFFLKNEKQLVQIMNPGDKYWKILSHVPMNYIRSEKISLLYSFLPVFFLLVFLLILGTLIITNISIQKSKKDWELETANQQLENKVSERTKQLSEINKDLAKEIVKHKKTEKKLQKKTNELERSNKELEEFAYIASHDLQEPLRKISSFSKLLEKRSIESLDEEGQKYLEFITSSVARMRTLISELLKYSKVSSSKINFDSVDLNDVIKAVLDDLGMVIKESNTQINFNNLPEIKADKTQMIQLMGNLVSNAIKYYEPGRNGGPKISINAKEEPNQWLVSVQDNGIGIDQSHYEKIFVIFQRLHGRNDFSGTGIGLGVCKKIVERHGGKIWVDSEKDKGSTFYFTIKN